MYKTEDEGRLCETLKDQLENQNRIDKLQVRYERDLLDRFTIYVIVSLGTNFSFELQDAVKRNIRRIVSSVQPAAFLFVRFI